MAAMTIARRRVRDTRKRVLRAAEELATQKMLDNSNDELTRTGIVWCGILGLDTAIAPSEVAAMLSAYDLVRATAYVDSEEYWTSAAAYVALGAHSEPYANEDGKVDDPGMSGIEKDPPVIGFAQWQAETSK